MLGWVLLVLSSFGQSWVPAFARRVGFVGRLFPVSFAWCQSVFLALSGIFEYLLSLSGPVFASMMAICTRRGSVVGFGFSGFCSLALAFGGRVVFFGWLFQAGGVFVGARFFSVFYFSYEFASLG